MEKLGAAAKTSITDMDKLSEEQGFKHVFAALQAIEKVTVVKKTEQFDRFFEKGFRKRGQPLDAYIRTRRQDCRSPRSGCWDNYEPRSFGVFHPQAEWTVEG